MGARVSGGSALSVSPGACVSTGAASSAAAAASDCCSGSAAALTGATASLMSLNRTDCSARAAWLMENFSGALSGSETTGISGAAVAPCVMSVIWPLGVVRHAGMARAGLDRLGLARLALPHVHFRLRELAAGDDLAQMIAHLAQHVHCLPQLLARDLVARRRHAPGAHVFSVEGDKGLLQELVAQERLGLRSAMDGGLELVVVVAHCGPAGGVLFACAIFTSCPAARCVMVMAC